MKSALLLLSLLLGLAPFAQAKTVEYDLVLAETKGPTPRFTEGDDAVIRVRNDLREDTSVHWHGLLVPNDQDGVPHVTMAPIGPGETSVYRVGFDELNSDAQFHFHSGCQIRLRGIRQSVLIGASEGSPMKNLLLPVCHNVLSLRRLRLLG